MTAEILLRKALAKACEQRGTQAEISKAFEVHTSTVKRWIDGGEIPPPMLKLLDFYFFGTVPPRIANPSTDPQAVLDFDEAEWAIIGSLARREGILEAQWIASRVRDYIAFLEASATGKAPLSSLPSAAVSSPASAASTPARA